MPAIYKDGIRYIGSSASSADVVEGYYYNGNFYKENTHTTLITGRTGKLYVDLGENKIYRYTGSGYTEMASGGGANVQSDWSQTNTSADDYIKNKPTVPAVTSTIASLTVNGWSNKSQTVTVNGVTASNDVVVSPVPASIDDYSEAEIKCTTQTTNSLTFTCETVPSAAITVNVLIVS